MSIHDSTVDEYDRTARELECWLATQAQHGVPELYLRCLLEQYALTIETIGFIPRTWLDRDDHPTRVG